MPTHHPDEGSPSSRASNSPGGTLTIIIRTSGTPNADSLASLTDSLMSQTECRLLPGFEVVDMAIGNAISHSFNQEEKDTPP